jgi:hypothetical protein
MRCTNLRCKNDDEAVNVESECFNSCSEDDSFTETSEEENVGQTIRRKSQFIKFDNKSEFPWFSISMTFTGPKEFDKLSQIMLLLTRKILSLLKMSPHVFELSANGLNVHGLYLPQLIPKQLFHDKNF